jgi:hypothetical protein
MLSDDSLLPIRSGFQCGVYPLFGLKLASLAGIGVRQQRFPPARLLK